MNLKELQPILSKGETPTVEFSLTVDADSIAKTVCAFLNGAGGRLFLGVDDNGQIVGIPNATGVATALLADLSSRISPKSVWTTDEISAGDHDLLVLEVPAGQDKPYVVRGAIYLRRQTQTVAANRNEITALIRRRTESSHRWERQPALGADRLDLDDELVQQTMQRARGSQRWNGTENDADGFLNDLGLTQDGKVTNACFLLYGKNPTRILPQARVRVLVLPGGKTADRYSVDRVFEACLLRTAKELQEGLNLYTGGVASHFSADNWLRSDKALYPASALREGVMNALIHRDYSSNAAITISIDRGSLKISNPGSLPDALKVADLKRDHPSVPRNPDIAHVCFLHGLIEKVGRGTQRIVMDCKEAKLPAPKWHTTDFETTLSLFSPDEESSRSTEELNERQQRILSLLQQRGQLTSTEVATAIGAGVTERTIRTDLQILHDRGLLTRKGKGRATVLIVAKPG
jgi:ATP-dependent DNA helicase RecG